MDFEEPVEEFHGDNLDHSEEDEWFVCPWKGVIANLSSCRWQSSSKLRDELRSNGFNVVKVHHLGTFRGFSGFSIVDFGSDWDGFKNAIMFERSFEIANRGRKNYFAERNVGHERFGWIARKEDYESDSLVGDHLRKNGDLKTITGKQVEDQRKTLKLVNELTHTLETKHQNLRDIEKKYWETSHSIDMVMSEKDEIVKSFNESNKISTFHQKQMWL